MLEPWEERELLHKHLADWIDLPLPLPPSIADLRRETLDLLEKQILLNTPAEIGRQGEILLQQDFELSSYLRPLNIESFEGYGNTIYLFELVLALTDEIGLRYKDRYNVPRPNQVEPRLTPFIPAPAHQSRPSNHAFQSFSLAFIFSRILPEHPASSQMFEAARRVAENREWAGVHYPSDTEAGYQLARMVAPVLEIVCKKAMLAALDDWI